MRISAGIHRSRTLFTPKNDAIRPTSDKIRQAVFNMLNARGLVQEAIVIDAFCGTGALGLEALSQGATYCTFFDKNKNSVSVCKQNIELLKEENRSQLYVWDATKVKPRPEAIQPATLIFFDPPYGQDLILKSFTSLYKNGWLSDESYFVIETARDETVSCPRINALSEKVYGDTKILLGELKIQNEY